MARKRDYWSRKAIMATGADYMLVYGQNCSGKSYQSKDAAIEGDEDAALLGALKGERFFYLRRMVTEINQNKATMYFEDMDVHKLTNGEWDGVEALQGLYYFWRLNENGKKERSEYIGAYGSLYDWQKIKSVAWVNFKLIIFEEFIAADYYLDDEPTKLQRVVTAIFRDHKGKVLMLGNTISRTCPYFLEWCPNVLKQQPGTIEIYNMHDEAGEGIEVKIACEYTGHVKGSGSMFFGQASKAIMAGEWDVVNSPKLPKDKLDYQKVYELVIAYKQFAFVVQLLVDIYTGVCLVYIYPRTTKRKIPRMITDTFSDDWLTTRYFKDTRPENRIRELIANEKVVYSDNLTASDFKNIYTTMGL